MTGESKPKRRSPAERAVRGDKALVAVANALNIDAQVLESYSVEVLVGVIFKFIRVRGLG